jgi:hypothetical protein
MEGGEGGISNQAAGSRAGPAGCCGFPIVQQGVGCPSPLTPSAAVPHCYAPPPDGSVHRMALSISVRAHQNDELEKSVLASAYVPLAQLR